MNSCTEAAKATLTHYIETIFRKNGLQWDQDNVSEIEGLVSDIIMASVNETLRILDQRQSGGL